MKMLSFWLTIVSLVGVIVQSQIIPPLIPISGANIGQTQPQYNPNSGNVTVTNPPTNVALANQSNEQERREVNNNVPFHANIPIGNCTIFLVQANPQLPNSQTHTNNRNPQTVPAVGSLPQTVNERHEVAANVQPQTVPEFVASSNGISNNTQTDGLQKSSVNEPNVKSPPIFLNFTPVMPLYNSPDNTSGTGSTGYTQSIPRVEVQPLASNNTERRKRQASPATNNGMNTEKSSELPELRSLNMQDDELASFGKAMYEKMMLQLLKNVVRNYDFISAKITKILGYLIQYDLQHKQMNDKLEKTLALLPQIKAQTNN